MSLKKQIRDNWRETYPRDEAWRREASRKAIEHILKSSEFQNAENIAIFSPLPWELDLTSLWQLRPQNCAFPKTRKEAFTLEFFKVPSLLKMKAGPLGLLEPDEENAEKIAHWSKTDLFLVPGFGFDPKGLRIGTGKGYYDRFFGSLNPLPLRWGVGFQAQLLKEEIPHEPHDILMNAICTEKGITVVPI